MAKKYYCPVCGYESDEPIDIARFAVQKWLKETTLQTTLGLLSTR